MHVTTRKRLVEPSPHTHTCTKVHTRTQMPSTGDDVSHKLPVWLMILQPGCWLLSGKVRFMPGSDQHSTFPNKPRPNVWLYSAANVHYTSLVISHSVWRAYIGWAAWKGKENEIPLLNNIFFLQTASSPLLQMSSTMKSYSKNASLIYVTKD